MSLSLLVVALCFFFSFSGLASAQDKITLQLKWKHQFQFAGYYAALAKGYYKERGLDVTIREAQKGEDPIQAVLDGKAEYGVGTSELLLMHAQGAPVVVLGVVFQHSPLALAALKTPETRYLHDVADRPLMIEPNSAELFAYFSREGVSKDQLEIVQHSCNINDLLDGKVGAMSVYLTDEPYELRREGVEILIFSPSTDGIDFYGDNFFTTQSEIRKNPERVKAFKEATQQGWRYAMENPEEVISLIHNLYTKRHSIEHLRFEANEMVPLLQPSIVSPGYMHEGRWRHIAETYADVGLLPKDYDMSGFLYFPDDPTHYKHLTKVLLITLGLLIIVGSVLAYVWRLNKRLKESEAWLTKVVQNTPSALIVMNERGTVLDWNLHAEEMFGWKKLEAVGKDIYELIIPEDEQEKVREVLGEVLDSGKLGISENWNVTRFGHKMLCDWRNVTPKPNVIVSMATDITERKDLEQKLIALAHTDPLTGLANRSLFFQKLEQSILLAKRQQETVAVLFLDLDNFKPVNDRYGHEVGDVVLCEVVQRIVIAVREADLLARIGGDEFALMLYNCRDLENAAQVAKKILKALETPLVISGISIEIGCSIGISLYPEHGDKATKLLNAADKAMYEVKEKAKNGIGFARPKAP